MLNYPSARARARARVPTTTLRHSPTKRVTQQTTKLQQSNILKKCDNIIQEYLNTSQNAYIYNYMVSFSALAGLLLLLLLLYIFESEPPLFGVERVEQCEYSNIRYFFPFVLKYTQN